MRKNGKILNVLLLGAAAAGLYYFRNTSKTNRYISGLRFFIAGLDIKNNILTIQLKIQNPNSQDKTVRSIVGDVYVNNTKVGNASSFNTVIVAGNRETFYNVDVRLKVLSIINNIADLTKGFAGSTLVFKGNANVDNAVLPINVKFSIK